jgi:signal transduction histidine kinase
MSFQRALMALTAMALLAGILPAVIAFQNRSDELESRARAELAVTPVLLADVTRRITSELQAQASANARIPDLAAALIEEDRPRAIEILTFASPQPDERPVLVGPRGSVWTGPAAAAGLATRTRHGTSAFELVADGDSLAWLALAPVESDGAWVGASGTSLSLGGDLLRELQEASHDDIVILTATGQVAAASDSRLVAPARSPGKEPSIDGVQGIDVAGRRFLKIPVPLAEGATVVFLRDFDRDSALPSKLLHATWISAVGAIAFAGLLGTLFALALAYPVRDLATAADRLANGDFDAPLRHSSIRELTRVSHAFDRMRRALSARVRELEDANRELEARQERLAALKVELLQRERLAASGRLVTELAHEIRNPVANLRNCLELIRRRMEGDAEGREFANLAIEEVLRMHGLAEQMLTLRRPRAEDVASCDVALVAREVATLACVGLSSEDVQITVQGSGRAAIAPDALKQVLLNLVENAKEARPHGLTVDIGVFSQGDGVTVLVRDNGPGIPAEILPTVFDPFSTTKSSVSGLGLGLFIAEGLVRNSGGRIRAANRQDEPGAEFRIELVAEPIGPRPATVHPDPRIPA